MELPYDAAIVLLGVYPKELNLRLRLHMSLMTTDEGVLSPLNLVTIPAIARGQSQCPLV